MTPAGQPPLTNHLGFRTGGRAYRAGGGCLVKITEIPRILNSQTGLTLLSSGKFRSEEQGDGDPSAIRFGFG